MHRWVVLLALAACEPRDPVEPAPTPSVTWVYPPSAGAFPLGASSGRLGRSQAPQPMVEHGIAAPADASAGPVSQPRGATLGTLGPLRQATPWAIPGDGPARAVVYGSEGDHPAIELIDIDGGRVVWRDTEVCAAPIVGATPEAIVCADARGTRAIGLDGQPRWQVSSPFIAFTEDRVVVSVGNEAIVLDAGSGEELARIKLPRGVEADSIVASCGDAGRELFAIGRDGRLVRVAEAQGGPAIRWGVLLGATSAVDGCDASVLATVDGPDGRSLVALARETGAITGRVDGVLGAWPAREDRDDIDGNEGNERNEDIEISTARGVARYARSLAEPPVAVDVPPLGALLASRADRRLVRATPRTAVLLDRAGVRAYLPLGADGVVLGDTSLLATSWTGAPGQTLHRFGLPPRWARTLRLPAGGRGVAVPAELRDLPVVQPLDVAGAIAQPDTAMHGVAAHALDPGDAAAVYAIAVDRDGERAAVARADLAARQWRWQRVDGCGAGEPVALAVARDVVVCGTRGGPGAVDDAARDGGAGVPVTRPAGAAGAGEARPSRAPGELRARVRATTRDGVAAWDWPTSDLDSVLAGGDLVVVVDAARLTVLDARDGRVRGHVTSDDAAAARVAIVALDDVTLVITAERGRVVARLGIAGLLPLWSIEIAGVVQALAASGEGVLVTLEDGDAYRVDARSAAITALPGLGLGWHADGDLVAGHTAGGPIPGPAPPPRPPTAAQLLRRPLQILKLEIDAPPMSTPVPPPPSLGESWQLTLYQLTGGLRARNDYALPHPIAPPAPRGPAGSPILVACGPGLRELVVLDPRTGDPLRRVQLPEAAAPGAVFGTVVDGSPVAGVVLGSPLRVVLF